MSLEEVNGIDLLDGVTDANGDPVSVATINGVTPSYPHTTALTKGQLVASADGTATFDPLSAVPAEVGVQELVGSLAVVYTDGEALSATRQVDIYWTGGSEPATGQDAACVIDIAAPLGSSQTNASGDEVYVLPFIGPEPNLLTNATLPDGASAPLYSVNGVVLDFANGPVNSAGNGQGRIDVLVNGTNLDGIGFGVFSDGVVRVIQWGTTGSHTVAGDLSVAFKVGFEDSQSADLTLTATLDAGAATVAPSVTSQPQASPSIATEGDTVTIDVGAASGAPTPTASVSVVVDGNNVAATDQGGGIYSFTAPNVVTAPDDAGTVTVTWANSSGTAQASDSFTVQEAATGTVADQTAEFGADTPAGQGGFRPIDGSGQAITLTSYQSLVSGSLAGYTPQISGGRLVFDQTGAPDGAVLRCAYAGGTIDLAVSEAANARSAETPAEARTAIQAYIAANASASRTVIMRQGTFPVGTHFANLQTNATAIAGIGGTRGAPRNPSITGGSITIRPGSLGSGAREKIVLIGQYNLNGARGLHFKNIGFAHKTDTPGYHYEPESKANITNVVAGNPTTITIAPSNYENNQVQPGDRLLCSNMTGGQWSNLNGIEIDVLSTTPLGNGGLTVTVNHDSSGYGSFSSGQIRGALQSTENYKCIYANSNGGNFPLAIFEGCDLDNRSYEPDPGLWPNGFEPAAADEIAFVGCTGDGFQHVSKALGWARKIWMIDNMFMSAYGDNYAVRTNRVIPGLLHKYPNVSVTNVSGANPARVTTNAAHGLSVGDTIHISGVNGAGQANGTWFVHNVVNTTTIELAEKQGGNRAPVDGSGWGNYQNGGTLYGPLACEIWIEGNYTEHANEPQWKSKHTDGVQGSSGQNQINCKWWIYDNVFNLFTDNGIGAQPIIGKGGQPDPTFHEGPIRGNIVVGSALIHLYGGLARSGKTEISYNTSIREPATYPNSKAGTRLHGDPNPIVGNIVGKLMNSGPTPSQESNFYLSQIDNSPNYNTVFAGTFVQGGDGVWRCPDLRNASGDIAARITHVKDLLTPNSGYKSFGATADAQSPYYVP